MSLHEYSPEKALELLLQKVKQRDESLALKIQSAIDAGKDVSVKEPDSDRRQKPRIYRKTVPLTHEEALEVALQVFQAYFLEIPEFIDSSAKNFQMAALGVPKEPELRRIMGPDEDMEVVPEKIGESKPVFIELQTETQISKTDRETFDLKPVEQRSILEEQDNLQKLQVLLNFKERDADGHVS